MVSFSHSKDRSHSAFSSSSSLESGSAAHTAASTATPASHYTRSASGVGSSVAHNTASSIAIVGLAQNTKSGNKDNILIDVTMDDTSLDGDDDDGTYCDDYPHSTDYPVEVNSHDPKIMIGSTNTPRHQRRRHQAAHASRHSSSSSSRCVGNARRYCGWFQVLFVLGWLLTIVLFGLLMRQLNSNVNDDAVTEWDDDNLALSPTGSPDSFVYTGDEEMEGEGVAPVPAPVPVPVPAPVVVVDSKPFILRINAGSLQDYTDPHGNVWIKDPLPISKTSVSVVTDVQNDIDGNILYTITGDGSIYQAPDDAKWHQETHIENVQSEGKDLYRDERWFNTTGTYEIPVPNHSQPGVTTFYDVILYFCEIVYQQPLERVFQVYLEDRPILGGPTLDLVAMGGGQHHVALAIKQLVQVTDGQLTIRFQSIMEHAKISGIEIIQIDS